MIFKAFLILAIACALSIIVARGTSASEAARMVKDPEEYRLKRRWAKSLLPVRQDSISKMIPRGHRGHRHHGHHGYHGHGRWRENKERREDREESGGGFFGKRNAQNVGSDKAWQINGSD